MRLLRSALAVDMDLGLGRVDVLSRYTSGLCLSPASPVLLCLSCGGCCRRGRGKGGGGDAPLHGVRPRGGGGPGSSGGSSGSRRVGSAVGRGGGALGGGLLFPGSTDVLHRVQSSALLLEKELLGVSAHLDGGAGANHL